MLDRDWITKVSNMKNRVVSEFDEGDWQMLATYLGDGGRVITTHSRLLRSLHWEDPDYPACVGEVLGNLAKDQPETFDLIEGMLNQKSNGKQDINVIAKDEPSRQSPSARQSTSGVLIDTTLATAMMPFAPSFDDVRASMRLACQAVGLELKAADDIWKHSILMEDVFDLIANSCIVIVDFTGKNPNVMYETGVAHALGKEVIPISQSLDDAPFDIRHHRIFRYDNNEAGRRILQYELEKRMKTIIEQHGWQPLPF